MARKRYSDEDALKVLREIDVHLHDGLDVVSSCRKAGISDKTYYHWRKKFGGMGRSQLFEMCALLIHQVSEENLDYNYQIQVKNCRLLKESKAFQVYFLFVNNVLTTTLVNSGLFIGPFL